MNETIKKILAELTDKLYLYTPPGKTKPPYVTYGVDGNESLKADNRISSSKDQGCIDLYTLDANDELIKAIPKALDQHEISFKLNSVQFEETSLLHYEWRWECGTDHY